MIYSADGESKELKYEQTLNIKFKVCSQIIYEIFNSSNINHANISTSSTGVQQFLFWIDYNSVRRKDAEKSASFLFFKSI